MYFLEYSIKGTFLLQNIYKKYGVIRYKIKTSVNIYLWEEIGNCTTLNLLTIRMKHTLIKINIGDYNIIIK